MGTGLIVRYVYSKLSKAYSQSLCNALLLTTQTIMYTPLCTDNILLLITFTRRTQAGFQRGIYIVSQSLVQILTMHIDLHYVSCMP